jgi:hypothetical protein
MTIPAATRSATRTAACAMALAAAFTIALTLALVLTLAIMLAFPSTARAQVHTDEVPAYTVSGRLLLSYGGTWADTPGGMDGHHLLVEGGELSLRGWLWEPRYLRFRITLLATRLDQLGADLHSYSLGYGGTLYLVPRSMLPVTLGMMRGLAVAGFTAERAASTVTTSYLATAQLVAPALPHVDVRAQRVESEGQDASRATNDSLVAAVYGTAPMQRYAAIFTWNADQYGSQPRTSRALATLSDDLQPTPNTLGHVGATITQGNGFGGASDAGFTGYQASASLLSRLTPTAVLRTAYNYAEAGGAGVSESSNVFSAGSTFQLAGTSLMLGEGVSAGAVTTDADGLHRAIKSVSASQGVATSGYLGAVDYGASVSGQAGYTSVSDGSSGSLFGYGGALSANLPLPGAPVRAFAQYSAREDHSTADLSSRVLSANVTSTITRLAPVVLLPYLTFVHVEHSDPASPGSQVDSSALAATISGLAPVLRTSAAFAAGYSDTWSRSSATRSSLFFGRLTDSFRLGSGTFGNVTLDLAHHVGGATDASFLASAVWAFRESQLSCSYTYTRAWPGDGGQQAVAVMFSRGFGATFLRATR